jgi:hypothetical protein
MRLRKLRPLPKALISLLWLRGVGPSTAHWLLGRAERVGTEGRLVTGEHDVVGRGGAGGQGAQTARATSAIEGLPNLDRIFMDAASKRHIASSRLLIPPRGTPGACGEVGT